MSLRKTTDIFVSDTLKKILEEISESSSIAMSLLKKRHYKEDLKEDEPINYLSISESDPTKLSYINHERLIKLKENEEDVWTSSRRFHARPGSVVNKIFKNLSAKEVEIFNNFYRSAVTRINYQFKVVDGSEIKYYYHIENYKKESHSLGNSCMKYDNCQRYFNIYIDNPEIIKMLVMLDDDGFLMGRALLWNFDDYKVMDRIYTINDDELPYQFKKWAGEHGYMYKYEQKWNNTLFFEMGGKKIEKKFSIKLPNWKYDRYPYLDTFKFMDMKRGVLYNYIPDEITVKTVSAPDGGYYNGDYLGHDFITGLYQNRGEMVSIKYTDDGKLIENSNLLTHSSNVEWSSVNDMYILRKDLKYDEEIDQFIFAEHLDILNNKENIEQRRIREKERRKKIEEHEIVFRNMFRGNFSRDMERAIHELSTRMFDVDYGTQLIEEMEQTTIPGSPSEPVSTEETVEE
jgi:hypothetical protein